MATGSDMTRHSPDHPLLTEALKLFVPVAAAHAVLLPLLWVTVFAFDLPFARQCRPGSGAPMR